MPRRRLSADYASFAIQSSSQGYTLLEELVVTHVFTDLDKAAFLAEIQDFYQERIVALIELFFESNPARLYPNFNDSIVAKELVETQFFSSILSKDIPVLNNIYHFLVT